MGYDSTNIFKIWISSRRKVIRSRDVLFNKKEFYSPADTLDLLYFLSQTLGSSQPYLITENIRLAFSDLDAEDKKLTETFTKNWLSDNTPHLQNIQDSTEDVYKESQPHKPQLQKIPLYQRHQETETPQVFQ